MSHRNRSRRILEVGGGVLAVFMLVFGPVSNWVSGQPAPGKTESPADRLIGLKMKFNGAASCKGSGCHDKAGDAAPPKEILHEFNIWKNKDRHAKAYNTLVDAKSDSKKIGAALKPAITDVKTSARCLNCHALNAPAPVQGAKFSIKEGNTCESCHGPSEKWLKDHATKGWQDDQRKKMNHDQLLTTFGLYDTRPLIVRAEMCASCHLKIDHDLVEAGHPVPGFELGWFSKEEPKHWFEKHGHPDGYINTKIWMAGQVVCVHDAMMQLSGRAKAKAGDKAVGDAWQQALAHATVFQPAAKLAGIAGLDEQIKVLEGLKPADTDKIAAAADAIAKICHDSEAKIEAWDPDANAPATATLFKALCDLKGMGTKYGLFGMDQQGKGISTLYIAWLSGQNKPLDDAKIKMIDDKIAYPPDPVKPEAFDGLVAEVAKALQ